MSSVILSWDPTVKEVIMECLSTLTQHSIHDNLLRVTLVSLDKCHNVFDSKWSSLTTFGLSLFNGFSNTTFDFWGLNYCVLQRDQTELMIPCPCYENWAETSTKCVSMIVQKDILCSFGTWFNFKQAGLFLTPVSEVGTSSINKIHSLFDRIYGRWWWKCCIFNESIFALNSLIGPCTCSEVISQSKEVTSMLTGKRKHLFLCISNRKFRTFLYGSIGGEMQTVLFQMQNRK